MVDIGGINDWDTAGLERLSSLLASKTSTLIELDDPHLTAVGHSYGSLTTGFALQDGTGVDDAVFMGSPDVAMAR